MNGLTILGTGGYTLPVVGNDELLAYLDAPKDSAWLEIKTGIQGHSLNFDCRTGKKRSEENVLDYAERACREAIDRAGVSPQSIDQLCLATCTPAQLHFTADAIELHRRLKLKPETIVDQIDGGCAALAKVFQLIHVYAKNDHWTVLVVGANDVASFLDRERYRRVPEAWLSPAIFADGAGAVVLGPGDGFSLIDTYCAVDGSHPLVAYKGGGAAVPTDLETLDAHAYVMNARDVAVQFEPAMRRGVRHFLRKHQWLCVNTIQRWYMHQANFRFIQSFMKDQEISEDCIPHNVDTIGNTVSASTLLLLHEDMKTGNFPREGTIIFLFVGAGMMEGGALFSSAV